MPDYGFDIATPLGIVWSLGPAQITYAIVGPTTLAYALWGTLSLPCQAATGQGDDTLTDHWRPFGIATVSLVPVYGGILAGRMLP